MRVLLLAALAVAGSVQAAEDPAGIATGLLEALRRGDAVAASARFDETMTAGLPPPALAQAWAQVEAGAGRLVSAGKPQVIEQGAMRIAVIRLEHERASLDLRVTVDAEGRVAGLFFVPVTAAAPAAADSPPAGVREIELPIGDGAGSLPSVLSLPERGGPFPAVVLVHGSGPHDRDETVGGAKPFRDLAWGLAQRGVAVLRYPKRTHAHAAAMGALGSRVGLREEVVNDAVAAVRALASRTDVDGSRLVVLGHSLGGMLAPGIAARAPDVDGLVMMAAPTRPIAEVVLEQVRTVAARGGEAGPAERARVAGLTGQLERLAAGEAAPDELLLGAPASYWMELQRLDPVATARQLPIPMLILQGERDYQVTMADVAGWRRGLGSRPDVTIRTYPGLNHLFVEGSAPSVPAEYALPARMETRVIEDVAGWVRALDGGPWQDAGTRGARGAMREQRP